ncbi:MAG: hypothetical protein A4E39_01128 [Methanoregulaceae archaeon PtaB.Bin152]|nr:MAG: hypothetical protein A4E39_01128 [Methanoregulaceae archaeon PtaB.Bin152]
MQTLSPLSIPFSRRAAERAETFRKSSLYVYFSPLDGQITAHRSGSRARASRKVEMLNRGRGPVLMALHPAA